MSILPAENRIIPPAGKQSPRRPVRGYKIYAGSGREAGETGQRRFRFCSAPKYANLAGRDESGSKVRGRKSLVFCRRLLSFVSSRDRDCHRERRRIGSRARSYSRRHVNNSGQSGGIEAPTWSDFAAIRWCPFCPSPGGMETPHATSPEDPDRDLTFAY